MRNLLILALILFTFSPFYAGAAELNAGFIDGLWFSEEPVFAEEPVRIYVALRNNSESDVTGTVRFFANEKLIGTKSISAVAGRLVEAWADWTPTYGTTTLRAELEKVQQHKVGENAESVTVTSDLAEETIFIDSDTDKDGTGNRNDTDDDNDGVNDAREREDGTDPLVAEKKAAETPSPSPVQSEAPEESDTSRETGGRGLEQLFNTEHVGQTALAGITETINTAKQNIDAYRETRAEEKSPAATNTLEKSPLITSTSATTTATITRTMLPREPGLFDTLGEVLSGLTDSLLTLALFLASLVLSNPALVEFVLLIGILFLAFAFARKFGQRRFK